VRLIGVAQLVTIKHIAEHLGVAVSTVGRALSGNPRISRATRDKVNAAARELGYVAHSAARQMRNQRSTLVGLVIPDVLNDFYSTAAQAISQSFDDAGFQMVLCISDDRPEVELRQVRSLAEARVAGVVVVPSLAPLPETLELLVQTPHVQFIRHNPRLRSDWFGLDDEATTYEATRHLIGLGHRRIAYFGGPRELSTGAARLRGYLKACEEGGVLVPPDLVFCDVQNVKNGRQAVQQLLRLVPPATGVVTATARGTQGVLEGLCASGVAVPEAMSIVGFNDTPALSWWGPGLTTMRLPVREIAIACCSLLLRRIAAMPGDTLSDPPQHAAYASTLMERGSTRAP